MISLSLTSPPRVSQQDGFDVEDEIRVGLRNRKLAGAKMESEAIQQIARLSGDSFGKACSRSVFLSDPYGIAAEQFRLMQRRLSNLRPDGGVVLLTSPAAEDGKSLNANNLAWALAEAQNNTLLLELDLRRPSLSQYLPGHAHSGVEEVLTGKTTPLSAVSRVHDLPLFYMGLNKPASKPVKLLRSETLNDLMLWARTTFSWIVVDGPPVLAMSDVEELLPKMDIVLMVVRERRTPQNMLERAADHLGDRLNFVIYNDVFLSDEYGKAY